MKKALLILAVLFSSVSMSAQVYEQGAILANAGVGLGFTYGIGNTAIPPIALSADYGVTDNIAIGGYLGYAAAKEEILGYEWKYSYTIIGARGTYHLDRSDDLDLYGGALLGYVIGKVTLESDQELGPLFVEPTVGGVGYSFFVGGRYMFSEKVGAFGELGYGISLLTLGLTAKF
ncbi:MAG: hypothetical protein ACPGWM_01730 [Flavobacteriales bacterium]